MERIFSGTLSWMERAENIFRCLEMILHDRSVRGSENSGSAVFEKTL